MSSVSAAAPGADYVRRPPPTASWAALPVILAPTFMAGLDAFIVTVALPSIQRSLHADPAQVESVAAGYTLAFGAGLITGGGPG